MRFIVMIEHRHCVVVEITSSVSNFGLNWLGSLGEAALYSDTDCSDHVCG